MLAFICGEMFLVKEMVFDIKNLTDAITLLPMCAGTRSSVSSYEALAPVHRMQCVSVRRPLSLQE